MRSPKYRVWSEQRFPLKTKTSSIEVEEEDLAKRSEWPHKFPNVYLIMEDFYSQSISWDPRILEELLRKDNLNQWFSTGAILSHIWTFGNV